MVKGIEISSGQPPVQGCIPNGFGGRDLIKDVYDLTLLREPLHPNQARCRRNNCGGNPCCLLRSNRYYLTRLCFERTEGRHHTLFGGEED